MNPPRKGLQMLLRGLDEAAFGPARTLNLRDGLPAAAEARARAESWLRSQQVRSAGAVLIVTGRGNNSPDGIGVVRSAVATLLPYLRRKGVVSDWKEHSPGSFVVNLAPTSALLEAPPRHRDKGEKKEVVPANPRVVITGISADTRALLRRVAQVNLSQLGIREYAAFVDDEMMRVFSTLSSALPPTGDKEAALRRALEKTLEELELI